MAVPAGPQESVDEREREDRRRLAEAATLLRNARRAEQEWLVMEDEEEEEAHAGEPWPVSSKPQAMKRCSL